MLGKALQEIRNSEQPYLVSCLTCCLLFRLCVLSMVSQCNRVFEQEN